MKDIDGKKVLLFILLIIGMIIVCVSCNENSKHIKEEETQKFEDQIHQDPATWNKEQRDRYNDFTKWETEQQENK